MGPRRLEPLGSIDCDETPLVGFTPVSSAPGATTIYRLDQSGRLFAQDTSWKNPQEILPRETLVAEEQPPTPTITDETKEPVKAFSTFNFVPTFRQISQSFLAESAAEDDAHPLMVNLDPSRPGKNLACCC